MNSKTITDNVRVGAKIKFYTNTFWGDDQAVRTIQSIDTISKVVYVKYGGYKNFMVKINWINAVLS